MKEKDPTVISKECHEKFMALPPKQQELILCDVIKGIHSMSGSFLAAMQNDTFAATVLGNMDKVANVNVIDELLILLTRLDQVGDNLKDMSDARLLDVQVPELCDNIRGCMKYTATNFNKVLFTDNTPVTANQGNVVFVNFAKSK